MDGAVGCRVAASYQVAAVVTGLTGCTKGMFRMAKIKKMVRGAAVALLAIGLAVTALPGVAAARDLIDLDRACSLVVSGVPRDIEDGARVRLYRAALVNAVGDIYTPTDEFAGYPVEWNGRDAQTPWGDQMAQTLAGYMERDGVEPLARAATGTDGSVRFDGLEVGLYLGVVEPAYGAGARYEFAPFMVQLPGLSTREGADAWVYDNVSVQPKHDSAETTRVSAVKVWNDDSALQAGVVERPAQIVVQLLRDGEMADEAALSEASNWRHTWENLEAGHAWRVVEKATAPGYTVSVGRDGSVFTVTNTASVPVPGEPGGGSEEPKLPQTSVLWWPVPVLLAVGATLLIAGKMRGRRDA